MKRTILRMLDEAVSKWGSAPYALRKTDAGFVAVSFAEARTRAREFAAWLLSTGFHRGDAVAIVGEGSPEWVIGDLALMMAGCVSVPLSVKLIADEIPFRLNHSETKAVLTTKNYLSKVIGSFARVDNKSIRVVYLDDDPDAARTAAAGLGFPADRLIGFDEARAAGRAAMASVSAALDKSIEAAAENDTVTICYTSGTTGNPKGIMLTHLNYWTNCHDAIEAVPIPPGWRTLVILPVDHSFAHTALLYEALVCSIALYFLDNRGGGIAVLRNIPINLLEANPNFLFTVPSLSGNFMKKIVAGIEEKGGIIEKLFKAGIRAGIAYNGNGFNRPPFGTRLAASLPYALARLVVFKTVARKVFGTSIRFCIGGGALLDVKQQEFFGAFGMPVYQGYGLTEASPVISANTPKRHKFGTSGVLMGSIDVRIVRPDGTEAAVGETGEIVIRGGSVMKGYFKNPEATAKALRDGWLWTGDLGYLDKDRFLVVVGREKALLIAEDGEKYSPEEIEEAVAFSTDVIDQLMAWCEQKKYTTALVALDTSRVETMAKARGIATAEELLKALQEEFLRYRSDPKAKKVQANWMPAVFQIVPQGFSEKDSTVNSMMKLVRHRVVELHGGLIDYSYTAEGSKTMNPRNLETLRAMFKLG
jgi:long-chain acyl-CoA synthetase